MLKTVRWDVISTQGSEEEDQKGAGGVRNQPGPEKEQPTLPTIGHCQPELKCLSFSWLSLYFHSKGYTQTIYRSVFAYSSTFLYGLIGNIFSPVVFFPTQPVFVNFTHVNTCCSKSFIIHSYLEFLWVNMPHLSSCRGTHRLFPFFCYYKQHGYEYSHMGLLRGDL